MYLNYLPKYLFFYQEYAHLFKGKAEIPASISGAAPSQK